jgi:hypothetical protein
MSKSLKALGLIVGVVLLLGIVGAGIVAAADPTPTPGTGTKTSYQQLFLSKVASILGISEQKLTDALNQAQKETQNQMIDDAVTSGRITKEYGDWLKQRPQQDGSRFGPGFGFDFGFGGRGFGHMRGGHGDPGKLAPTPTPTTR